MKMMHARRDLLHVLLADLLDDAARTLRKGVGSSDAEALALHLLKLDGPHRSAWSKLVPLTYLMADRPAVRRLVDELTEGRDVGTV